MTSDYGKQSQCTCNIAFQRLGPADKIACDHPVYGLYIMYMYMITLLQCKWYKSNVADIASFVPILPSNGEIKID